MSEELTVIELTEENIESMIYVIRDRRVMLDFDLARIYGYITKRFNEQVKRNIEKFPEDFMFQLTKGEVEYLSRPKNLTTKKCSIESNDLVRCKNFTSKKSENESEENERSKILTPDDNSVVKSNDLVRSQIATTELWTTGNGGRSYLPYAFTEQGIYMLMTVLKGELAVKQSKALIRLFKRMKDYIIENKGLIGYNASLINDKFLSYDKKFEDVDEKLKIVMDNFIDPSTYKSFLILDGQKIEADLAYQTIYSLATQSIYVIDDYIGIKTLHLLMGANKEVKIILISDNTSRNPVQKEYLEEFKEETGLDLVIIPSNNRCHDRYIVIDFQSDHETIYHCGSSSKDTGHKITTIMKIENPDIYHTLLKETIANNNEYFIVN